MKKVITTLALALALALGAISAASAYTVSKPTYRTNDYNRTHHGPHVDLQGRTTHTVTLTFVNPNNYYACFEYRTDGNTSQRLTTINGGHNFNTAITDGLYPYLCLNSVGTQVKTFTVNQYVEVRSVFGAERDWDFTWTRFNAAVT